MRKVTAVPSKGQQIVNTSNSVNVYYLVPCWPLPCHLRFDRLQTNELTNGFRRSLRSDIEFSMILLLLSTSLAGLDDSSYHVQLYPINPSFPICPVQFAQILRCEQTLILA